MPDTEHHAGDECRKPGNLRNFFKGAENDAAEENFLYQRADNHDGQKSPDIGVTVHIVIEVREGLRLSTESRDVCGEEVNEV